MANAVSTKSSNPYQTWRGGLVLSPNPEEWPDDWSVVRSPPRELTPDQADLVERVVAVIQEVPRVTHVRGYPQRTIILRYTTHRKRWARACLLRAFLDEGDLAIGKRLGMKRCMTRKAIRAAPAILLEYFTREEFRAILDGVPSGPLPPSPPPPPGPPASAGTSPPSPGGAGPGSSTFPSNPST